MCDCNNCNERVRGTIFQPQNFEIEMMVKRIGKRHLRTKSHSTDLLDYEVKEDLSDLPRTCVNGKIFIETTGDNFVALNNSVFVLPSPINRLMHSKQHVDCTDQCSSCFSIVNPENCLTFSDGYAFRARLFNEIRDIFLESVNILSNLSILKELTFKKKSCKEKAVCFKCLISLFQSECYEFFNKLVMLLNESFEVVKITENLSNDVEKPISDQFDSFLKIYTSATSLNRDKFMILNLFQMLEKLFKEVRSFSSENTSFEYVKCLVFVSNMNLNTKLSLLQKVKSLEATNVLRVSSLLTFMDNDNIDNFLNLRRWLNQDLNQFHETLNTLKELLTKMGAGKALVEEFKEQKIPKKVSKFKIEKNYKGFEVDQVISEINTLNK